MLPYCESTSRNTWVFPGLMPIEFSTASSILGLLRMHGPRLHVLDAKVMFRQPGRQPRSDVLLD